ncbi:hypothetical protein SAZ10_32860 [Mesorhizobium sp. BAC0120]|uniref:hypothetical protein n=1 Tax=Mesorhizobium sp. BAC0120 TaxID=3090670 RepID=UPI00298C8117|nr:hypothetical protein [Mesorhizobium sp. BAC0120]MDW6026562.1 hypothetical protein [Mesorhizobium sp. BAC0120]
MIEVIQVSPSDPLAFEVTIREAAGETHHHVTMARRDYDRLTNGTCRAEHCVEAAFRFLLDREPKEAILSRFDVSVISRYFPDFEAKLPQYIAMSSAEGNGR